MAKSIMIQGTTSNAGKSLLAAGLCRILRQDGYTVAPFKSQNMALNSYITPDGLEMGRAQAMQAECAGIAPDVRMNPILLKPNSDTGSQVIVNGQVRGNMRAAQYFAQKQSLIPEIMDSYQSLAAEYDVIVLEGAGSPAEINLKKDDIVNMGMAKMARSPVLLVGDINPGGVFASIAGTLQLLEPEERDLLKGVVINKFRGDLDILRPGLVQLENIIHKPVLGVVPYLDLDIDDEDSLSDRLDRKPTKPCLIDIAVIRFPRLSNFTDFTPLDTVEGVQVRYITSPADLGTPDLLIFPGTKSPMQDLLWLRQSGLEPRIMAYAQQERPVFGIGGGYQMLGQTLSDPSGAEGGGSLAGLGLLEIQTVFTGEQHQGQVEGFMADLGGIFTGLSSLKFRGYELYSGTVQLQDSAKPLGHFEGNNQPAGAWQGHVYGTCVHGLFEDAQIVKNMLETLLHAKGLDFSDIHTTDSFVYKQQQYDRLAKSLRNALDMEKIYSIIEAGA